MCLAWSLPVGENSGNTYDYFKRGVCHSAPRRFKVDDLPPTRFDKSYYFGLKIYPILDNVTTISGVTTSVYEIWRTWDDCLWFQDLLENSYGAQSREKRRRLQVGKGIKKNGVYIHDRASSFESLPPGPDPKSVAKDIHQYLPELSKQGTLLGASQETVNQRQKEFSAFIHAFLQEDVPSLICELREDRAIKDFFGYWRRDLDLAAKRSRHRPEKAPANGIRTTNFISSFFSTLRAPVSHPLPQRSHTTDPTLFLFHAGSELSAASNSPLSAPARLGSTLRDGATSEDEHHALGRKNSTSPSDPCGLSPIAPTSSRRRATPSDSFSVTSDFPLFLSSSTYDLLPSSRPSHSPSYVTPRPETLLEDTAHESLVSNTSRSPPTLRILEDPPERANHNLVLWPDTDDAESDDVSSSEGDVLERELLTPVGLPVPANVTEGDWSDQGEDFFEACLGGPEPFFSSRDKDSITHDNIASDFPLDIPDDPLESPFVANFSTPRPKNPYIDEPPRALHHPGVTASLPSRAVARR